MWDGLTAAFQPQQFMIAPAADGCKRWLLLGIAFIIVHRAEEMLEKPLW